MKQLQLDRRPQAVPGTREDTIYKPIPQLRESRLHALAQRTDQRTLLSDCVRRQQQQVGFFNQQVLHLLTSIAPISQAQTTFGCPSQELGQRRGRRYWPASESPQRSTRVD